ncbi:MAG: helix-turn-helix domain-containing protein [Candidatus Accumulibacter propinquus]|uniref:helix-turn-helix domain-containing protein n=1 Tax=Candidatus Accumulibacter TaxID=327159 RepID=UPI001AD40195|nr:helix-turn-helix domain-containing protein [Accumulibacter sp.]MBK8387566.1 helix-turn-helix domain-containing protein [Accumulibacter sp.]MBN8438138.1 helix-turn-helix domain-containing protein [Accumulibacter sp.]
MAENIVFSTADLRPAEQFPYWREVVCASITRLSVERRGSGPFLAEMRASSLGGLHIVTARADAHQRRRSREDIARETDDPFFLYLPLAGSLRLEYADGQQLVAAPGTPCFLDPLRVARADAEAGLAHLTIKAPRPLLAPLLAQPAMRPPREPLLPTGLNALLVSYARSLMHAGPIDSDCQAAVAANFCGLLALVLGASDDGRDAGRGGTAQALLTAAQNWLSQHHADPSLNPAALASHLGVSLRYVHKLFESSGRSFSRTLVERRLHACHAALADPFRDRQTVADIAFANGFNDLSHFNRHFKAAYGMTPRDWRQASRN